MGGSRGPLQEFFFLQTARWVVLRWVVQFRWRCALDDVVLFAVNGGTWGPPRVHGNSRRDLVASEGAVSVPVVLHTYVIQLYELRNVTALS